MNPLFGTEHAIRTVIETFYVLSEKEQTTGLILWRDVERSRTMTGAELIGHAEELAMIAAQIGDRNSEARIKAQAAIKEAITEYRKKVAVTDEHIAGVRFFWPLAHRCPAPRRVDSEAEA